AARIGGDRADVVAQAFLRSARRRDNDGLLAAAVEAEKRRRILLGPTVLAAERHDITGTDGEMADRELVQLRGEAVLFDKIAGIDIDIDERGLHVGKVQLAFTV